MHNAPIIIDPPPSPGSQRTQPAGHSLDRSAPTRATMPNVSGLETGAVLFPARAFLAFGWLRAGVEKVIEPTWWTGDDLLAFVDEHRTLMLPPADELLTALVVPWPAVTAAIVAVVELLLGVCLLTGRRLSYALGVACLLNVVFVVLGVVSPSAFYLVLQLTLLLWLAAASGWWTVRRRTAVIIASITTALAAAPFVSTIHPADVIHDPAITLATIALLAAASQAISLISQRLSPPRPTTPALSSPT